MFWMETVNYFINKIQAHSYLLITHVTFAGVVVSKYNKDIVVSVISEIFCDKLPSEEDAIFFAKLLCVLDLGDTKFERVHNLVRGIGVLLRKFVENKELCSSLINLLSQDLTYTESKQTIVTVYKTALEKSCYEEGIVETVVKAIDTHIDCIDVCEVGCGALMNLTANNSKKNAT